MPSLASRRISTSRIDWVTVFLYISMVILGWLSIFAAVYDPESSKSIFDLSINSGKQLLWIGTAVVLIAIIFSIDYKFYESFSFIIYGIVIFLLLLVLVIGKEVAGSKSWLGIGSFGIQPAEFAKLAVAMAMANYMSMPGVRVDKINTLFVILAIIFVPAVLILLQNDTGSTLVFFAFIIVLFREGLNPAIPILGIIAAALLVLTLLVEKIILIISLAVIAFLIVLIVPKKIKNFIVIGLGLLAAVGIVAGVDYFIQQVLQPHQRNRIMVLVNPDIDPLGVGWNVTQSKIAIGSGGFSGKGFLQGTQTKFDFVPEQSTDFIFCTIAEEMGWIGSLLVISLFVTLLLRIIFLAERQRMKFAFIYGYAVAAIFFFHFAINIGMTIGLLPVIGIPLPFFSYGGSSLWSFTILLFILLKLDAHRSQVLARKV